MEEEDIEEKVSDHYDAPDNVDFGEDSPHPDSDQASEDEEDVDDQDLGSDPEYCPEDEVLGKPTVIRIMKRDQTEVGKEKKHQCDKSSNRNLSTHVHRAHNENRTSYLCDQTTKHGEPSDEEISYISSKIEKSDDNEMDVEFIDKIREVRRDNRTWYVCKVCQFESKSSDIQHIRNHIEGQHLEIEYPCDLCDKVSNSLSGFKDHKRNNHSQKPFKVLYCEYCGFSTQHSGAFRKHVNSVHLNIKSFQCEVCDKKFTENRQLKLHIQSVHEQKKELCDICFKYVRRLKGHRANQHKTAKCKYCAETLNNISSLNTHVEKFHKEKKLLNCPSCDYTTYTKALLKKHDQLNHNINYIYCDQCEWKTKLKSHLRKHQKEKHDSSFKKFTCKYCDYQADRKTNVDQHQRSVHENVRYPCDQCDYQATRRQYLYKHIETFHKK